MTENPNAALLDAVCAHVPKDANPSQVIGEELHLGREAAYRRLRGEVPFSFFEAATLSERLHFSLDTTVGAASAGKVPFELRFNDFQDPLGVYDRLLEQDIRFFSEAAADPAAEFAAATNSLPPEFYLRYRTLADFKLFKWLYQHKAGPEVRCLEELEVPASIGRNYLGFVAASQRLPLSSFVFDASGFQHWVNAIRAYRAMHLISAETLRRLREELLLLIDDLQHIADEGCYPNGNRINLYLSDVDIECRYRYVKSGCCRLAAIGIFSLNALCTGDRAMYEYVRGWIVNQSRFSTLISRSGEMQRIHYFKRQREIVSMLG